MSTWVTLTRPPAPEIDRRQSLIEAHLMARLLRFDLPGIPHHITQRGNRREQTFFELR